MEVHVIVSVNWTNKVSGFWDLGGLFEDQLGEWSSEAAHALETRQFFLQSN